MGTLYVTEYTDVDAGSPREPAVAEHAVVFDTSTQSSAFNPRTVLIRVQPDTTCSVKVGVDPTATTGSKRMVAGQTEYWSVAGGLKIAAVTNV
jgi:hypothetical protein